MTESLLGFNTGNLLAYQQAVDINLLMSVFDRSGVFKSAMLLERFRLLVELEDGNKIVAPQYGPGTGALIEAYAAAGLSPTLQNVPAEKY